MVIAKRTYLAFIWGRREKFRLWAEIVNLFDVQSEEGDITTALLVISRMIGEIK